MNEKKEKKFSLFVATPNPYNQDSSISNPPSNKEIDGLFWRLFKRMFLSGAQKIDGKVPLAGAILLLKQGAQPQVVYSQVKMHSDV